MRFPRFPLRATALLLGAALVLAACDSVPMAEKSALVDDVTNSVQSKPTKLQSGEKVRIVVYGEDRMTGDFEIDPTGHVTVPLVGQIVAAERTKEELSQAISRKLKSDQILRNPVVSVDVAAFRPFYVLGEVEKPGQYAFANGLNVMSAAAIAGGYTYRASRSQVHVQRAGEKAFKSYPLSPDVMVYPGDLVRVPERYF